MIPRKGNCSFSYLASYLSGNFNRRMNKSIQKLTAREKQVLILLSTGLTYDKVAQQLNISHETVKMHLKKTYRKLNVKNKVEAITLLWN